MGGRPSEPGTLLFLMAFSPRRISSRSTPDKSPAVLVPQCPSLTYLRHLPRAGRPLKSLVASIFTINCNDFLFSIFFGGVLFCPGVLFAGCSSGDEICFFQFWCKMTGFQGSFQLWKIGQKLWRGDKRLPHFFRT